jgi:predicted Zn-dependent peptidase
MRKFRPAPAVFALALAACTGSGAHRDVPPPPAPPAPSPTLNISVEYYRLANGLRVVLSHDDTVPTTTVAVYYHIGFRSEPKGRTGFAHLFEHLMFEETTNLDKGEAARLVTGSGGISNGSTRFDFTNYFQVVPSHALRPVLWAEADRMRGLALTQKSFDNQKDVVKSEVRVNVLNRPYGGFGWLDLPQYAFTNWSNAHNFYGDFADLDAATLADVKAFYDTYYVPSNAVLVVAGDFDRAAVRGWIDEYFGALPTRPAPRRADVSEPPQTAEIRASHTDPLAPRPGLAVGYHLPPRNSREWFAFGLLDQILLQGEDSRLWRRLVAEKGYTDRVEGGMNLAGNMFNYEGPMIWSFLLIHDPSTSNQQIIDSIDAVLADAKSQPVSAVEIERALTKMRSELYDLAGSATRFGLVDLLAAFALFDDNPARINSLELEFRNVTPEELTATARQYLRPENRTVMTLIAGGAAQAKQK